MKRQLLKHSAVLAAALICFSNWSFAWEYPVIKGYGPVHPLPNAALQPDKSIGYKVLFDITQASKSADKVNPGLGHVARFLNVMATAGIMHKDMELAVVLHGAATPMVLKNEIFISRRTQGHLGSDIVGSLTRCVHQKEVRKDSLGLYTEGYASALRI